MNVSRNELMQKMSSLWVNGVAGEVSNHYSTEATLRTVFVQPDLVWFSFAGRLFGALDYLQLHVNLFRVDEHP